VISVVEFLELAGADRDAAPPPPADQLIESAEHKVDTALAELDFNGRAERKVELGLPAGILADESASVDLMVCGSRGYGLVRQVLLGGVSTRLIRSATCPVVVTPRSATHD
jgi:nucleotide-binding universal stress UspA family protein